MNGCNHQWLTPAIGDRRVTCRLCGRWHSIARLAADVDLWTKLIGQVNAEREAEFTQALYAAILGNQDRRVSHRARA